MVLMYNELTQLQQKILLDVAEQSARVGFTDGEYSDPHVEWYPAELQSEQACFVSLHLGDRVLGSVGTTAPQHPLIIEVARNSFEVALTVAHQPRFWEYDLRKLKLEVAVLSPLHFISETTINGIAGQIEAGRNGVFVRCHNCTATFLPEMWKKFTTSRSFLEQLCARAGIESDAWPMEAQVATFTTQRFSRTIDKLRFKPIPR